MPRFDSVIIFLIVMVLALRMLARRHPANQILVNPGSGGSESTQDWEPRPGAMGTIKAPHYTVAERDRLYRISLRFKVSVDDIKNANGFTSDTIYPNHKLVIPSSFT